MVSETVSDGTTVNLVWFSNRAQTCTAIGSAWSATGYIDDGDSIAANDNINVGPLNYQGSGSSTAYAFGIRCSNIAGSDDDVMTVYVNPPTPGQTVPAPTVNITASPTTVDLNSQNPCTELEWMTTNNPTSCTAGGDWSGDKATGGGKLQVCYSSSSDPRDYTYSITCTNDNPQSGSDSVTVTTTRPAQASCTVTSATANGQHAGSATVSMAASRNRVDWYLNGNYVGTNGGPNADFSRLSNNTNYQVSATQWDSTGSNSQVSCTCNATNNCTFTTGQGPTPTSAGGGRGTPTPAPPTPTPEPLEGTGAIRFYNADCTTAYNGADTFTVLSLAQTDGSYEGDMYASGGGHNALFYNGKASTDPSFSHNANEGVRGCDST
ncbi:MAG: hypothetical protein AAB599_02410, partial [Patescibacteria group bacterium]